MSKAHANKKKSCVRLIHIYDVIYIYIYIYI